ncbi:MAG: NAD-dependent epimerase/dehydratase family protein, partial [Proteobacteria bacterium]|nr:NAD-dependent epimerase/dehydratase family protein [Pseudomonadota bacterium]
MATLITGGTGYIGGRLINRLLSMGEEVVVFALPAGGEEKDTRKGVTVHIGDIRDPAAVRRAMNGCSRVYHLAAY